MIEEWIDQSPAEKRLSLFLDAELSRDDDNDRLEKLSTALGYTNSTIVKKWVSGKAKVPLQHVTAISDFLNCDISDVLPLWLSQELPDDWHLYSAGKRMLSVWEFMLVNVARDVYNYERE
jgi:DNA-binding Xre family transcriptional regulator